MVEYDFIAAEMRGPIHVSFARLHGPHGNGRLVCGLDFVKAMPREWNDAQKLAQMVRLYDELLIKDSLF